MERTAMHIENMVHMDEYTSKTMLVTNTAFNQNRKTNDQQWFSKHIPTIKFLTDFFCAYCQNLDCGGLLKLTES